MGKRRDELWCRPDCYQLVVEHVLVPFLYQLMSSSDERQVVEMRELENERTNQRTKGGVSSRSIDGVGRRGKGGWTHFLCHFG